MLQLTSKQVNLFWSKVRLSEGCWLWTKATNNKGYGNVRINKKYLNAHRVAYAITYGDPGKLWVLHSCDNPSCVRPDHLFLGTHQDNMDDMRVKGRSGFGPPCVINAAKTHCINGHPLTGPNLYIRPNGARSCRTCCRGFVKRYRRKMKAKEESNAQN